MLRVWIAILVVFVSLFRVVAMAEQPQAVQNSWNNQSVNVLHGSATVSSAVTKPSGQRQVTKIQWLFDALDSDATIPTLVEVTQKSLVAEGTSDFSCKIFRMNFPEDPKKIPKPGNSFRL